MEGNLTRFVTIVATLLVALSAHSAPPAGDRPTESATASLVAAGTVEIESGVAWRNDRFAVPFMLKVGIGGIFEPRVGIDLAAHPGVGPELLFGFKLRGFRTATVALSFLGAATVPVGEESPRYGTVRALLDITPANLSAYFGVNVGLNVDWRDGTRFAVPVSVVAGVNPAKRVAVFLEGAVTLSDEEAAWIVNFGLGYLLTPHMVLDLNVGWDLPREVPFVNAGFTLNFGS